MNVIEQTYHSLLADVSSLSGLRAIRGLEYDSQWGLLTGPKLEKLVLQDIENGTSESPSCVPKALKTLTHRALSDPMSLRYLRQLLLFSYKSNAPHSSDTVYQAFESFDSTNVQVGEFANSFSNTNPRLLNLVRRHVQSVLYRFEEKDILPSHGPGASTTSKDKWSRWYPAIDSCYPYGDYFGFLNEPDSHVDAAALTDEHITAKLMPVPKDGRGPRLICVHPAESIWIQQGLRLNLERAISCERVERHSRSSRVAWPVGHVHFDDQTVNGSMALSSSLSREFATIDMKEASDRVSDVLVQILFGRKYKSFGCCRAQKYYVSGSHYKPKDTNIHSYAPMGNATTFPVQSLVFWAICVASMQSHGFHQPDSVYVFGDDIVVPTSQARRICDDLESFGLKVNASKTFINGGFRESCGVDAFNGVDVTPVRWKTSHYADTLSDIQSLSDTAMRMRRRGFDGAAIVMYDHIRNVFRAHTGKDMFTTNNPSHGGIAEYVDSTATAFYDAYWHRDVQWFVSPVWRLQEDTRPRVLRGWNHVLESVCSLERTGHSNVPDRAASRRLRLTRGWIPVL